MTVAAPAVIDVVPAARRVAALHAHEVYRAQAFHAGHLWLGHSAGDVTDYRLDVHDAAGATVAGAAVPHTLEFLHPFGPRSVVAVGKHHGGRGGWRTYHTVATLAAGGLRVRTWRMPARFQVERFGGSPRAMFFNETGLGRILRWNGFWASPLPPTVHFPATMLHCGRHLFVLERNHFLPGEESIARVDLASGAIERTFRGTRRRLTTLLDLEGLPWIAAPESWADRVLLVDKAANRLAAEIPVEGGPVEVGRLGDCLVVTAQDARQILFFHLRRPGFPQVARWDLAEVGRGLGNIRALDVDPATGSIFLRSPYHVTVGADTPAVTMLADPDGATYRACTGRDPAAAPRAA